MADAENEDSAAEKDAPKDLLGDAKERYRLASEYWSPNHKLWLEDAKFRNLEQWPDTIKELRGEERPCLVVDKCNQYVRQVVNDGRQNRPAVKVRPIDDNGDDEVAEAFQGIIRHICDRSNADEAFDTALDHAAGNGFGFFRVVTDYAHRNTFKQELMVKRIRNPLTVLLDPNIRAADGSDADWGFVVDELPKEKFKQQFPQAKKTNWDADGQLYGDGWLSGENVRFVEYFYKEEVPRLMHLLEDGTEVSDDDYQLAQENANGEPVSPILKSRDIPECQVKWCRLSGAEVLEEKDWDGAYIPLIPVFGNESDIAGKVTYSGLIRAAKDPQRLYNYMRSAFAERVALTPKSPYIAAEGQLEGHEDEWERANTDARSVLIYKPTDVDGKPVPAPQRQSPSDIPEGFARDMQLSEHDIQASMGMYAASVGQPSNEKSGKAIMARQREGDTATFHYQDNLNRAIRYLGRILVDLIPKVYDSRRVVRILGEDGTAEEAEINPEQEAPVQKINTHSGARTIYNLNVGTYDVSVAAGPSYTTKRQEALEAGMQLAQANPQIWALIGDIVVRNADWPGADEIAERLHAMLPPPILAAENAEKQGQDPKVMAAVAPLQQQLQQSQQQIQAAEAGIHERDQALQKAQQENDALKSDRELNARKLDLEMAKAYNERLKLENEARNTPPDPAAAEAMRLEHEDKWKQMEVDKDIIVAAIGAKQATETASIGATAAQAQASPVDEIQAPEVDTNAAIAMALQNLAETLGRPKVATMPDGRQIHLQ